MLSAELPLSPAEAVLGGEVKVPTPDGEAVVNVPAGISAGRSLRLRGKGWPLKGTRGDLLLTVQLQFPINRVMPSGSCINNCSHCLATTHATACFKTPGSDRGIP